MSLMDTGLMRLLGDRMAYQGQRMAVLSENVANANTPGYKARDLAPYSFADAMDQAAKTLRVTQSGHMVPASMAGVNAQTQKAHSFETVPTGNSVDLEQQMMNVSQTSVDYQSFLGIYHKMVSLFRTAVSGSK